MSEYKKRIAIFVVIAVIAAGGLAAAISGFSPGTGARTSNANTTEQNDFTLSGPSPLITITPQNNTFTLTYAATTLGNPVSFSLNLSQSWITTYTNGTEWTTYSQVCSTSSAETASSGSTTTQTPTNGASVVVVTGTPCGVSPVSGWVPVNGSAASQRAEPDSSQVQMSAAPTSISADQTSVVQFTITLNLKPGVYAVGLALGVQTAGAYGGFEFSDLSPLPVVVK
jgi:hypothetical protein